jgi:molybdenum cofactor cytidylyltransferase
MICAIVLAAGESRRMGSQKLLLPFGAITVIGRVVDQLLQSVIDKNFVVTGHNADKIAEELSARAVTIVDNPDYPSGMLSSVRCGLRALPRECQAVMVALGDQPAITTNLIDDIIQAFKANHKGIVVPVFQNRRGHPILFDGVYRDEILVRYDDVGLHGLLHAHPDDVLELAVSEPSVLSDMDCPEDYQRELARLEEENA